MYFFPNINNIMLDPCDWFRPRHVQPSSSAWVMSHNLQQTQESDVTLFSCGKTYRVKQMAKWENVSSDFVDFVHISQV